MPAVDCNNGIPVAANICKTPRCGLIWKDLPGAYSQTEGRCPACGGFYFKWRNYADELRGDHAEA